MSETPGKSKAVVILSVWGALIVIALGIFGVVSKRDKPVSKPAAEPVREDQQLEEDIKTGKVAAVINGTAVYLKELDKGLPEGTFGPRLTRGRKMRLDRFITNITLSDFLKSQNIEVPEKKIMEQLDYYQNVQPPALTCGCCYPDNLEAYFELEFTTLDDLILEIKNSFGLEKYLDAGWEKKLASEGGKEAYAEKHAGRLKKEYAKTFQIFFDVINDPAYSHFREKAWENGRKESEEIYKRLKAGESFGGLAKQYSDDDDSKDLDGFVGFIMEGYFSDEYSGAVFALKPGELSAPLKTDYGYHILKREDMSEFDMLVILENEFREETVQKLLKSLKENAEIRTFLNEGEEEESIDYLPEENKGK